MIGGMQKIGILGFGREGHSLLNFLRRSPKFKNSEIWVRDKKHQKVPRGVKTAFGSKYLRNLAAFDVLFRSPGIPYLIPEIQRAKKNGVQISSATKLFFEELNRRYPLRATRYSPCVIGVTGTKGKGTTSTLIYKMLKAAGKKVFLAGNIGTPALDLLNSQFSILNSAYIFLELSSFQLQDLEISPHIAVVLDIFPDHQDSHTSLQEYYSAKANIARYQKQSDTIFFFEKNAKSRWIGKQSRGKKVLVNPSRCNLFRPSKLQMPGAHNFQNAVMAATVTQSLGIKPSTIRKVVEDFKGNEHRLELVHTVNGVRFYNDSASTNPHTTAAAIRAFPKNPVILIAGGQDKNLDYAPLAKALKNSSVKLVILMGENKNKIARTIKKSGVPIKFAKTLKGATTSALRTSALHTTYYLPPTVLFSPGATSFDMFKDYADRGAQFKKIVKSLH
ncbi:MAG: UDP-N-acetylmuramoyl-L-alanine--D-glutamate ligase [Candidatus Liptonbacteria bacterium]|nr:UDP-N-acetylmuramoyl-L-alanine--D-glutamate ligase [Candidatus Liptonbacteria bacterium]